MTLLAYSTCRMEFTPTNKPSEKREYGERSTIELRVDDTTGCFLRAVDVQNDKAEICHVPLKGRNQYNFGRLGHDPDVLKHTSGTYRIWLNEGSSEQFRDTFVNLLDALFPVELSETNIESAFPDQQTWPTSSTSSRTSTTNNRMETSQLPTPNTNKYEARDILTNIRNLTKSIQQGNGNEATKLVAQFVAQGIRLRPKATGHIQDDTPFQVLIQIDGNEYAIDQSGGTIPVEVFPSTTVRELRAAFEVIYNYPPASQYFFVNGLLTQDDSSMRELHVGQNSLFVLFLITHPKKFKDTGPWQCSSCQSTNQPAYFKCRLCSASRAN